MLDSEVGKIEEFLRSFCTEDGYNRIVELNSLLTVVEEF